MLGNRADNLLTYKAKISTDSLHLSGSDFIERIFINSGRSSQVLRSLSQLYSAGRLANRGYMSILPVERAIEHSGAASFAPIQFTLTPKTLLNWLLKVAVMRWRQLWAFWA